MKAKAGDKLPRRPLTGHWFRAVRLRFWSSPLSCAHSVTTQSRFGAATPAAPGHRLIYLAENHQVALLEVEALFGSPTSPVSNPKGSWIIMGIEIVLSNVVDLTEPAHLKILGTSHSELTGNWTNFSGVSPTQELGRELGKLADLEGFLFHSSKSNAKCLAIFPDKLSASSRVSFGNEITGRTEQLV